MTDFDLELKKLPQEKLNKIIGMFGGSEIYKEEGMGSANWELLQTGAAANVINDIVSQTKDGKLVRARLIYARNRNKKGDWGSFICTYPPWLPDNTSLVLPPLC